MMDGVMKNKMEAMEEYHTRMRKIATPVPVSYLSIFNSKYIQYRSVQYTCITSLVPCGVYVELVGLI